MTESLSHCRPNFFLIGAAKCGTTSVAHYLAQHPEIFVSKPKEPNFFSFEPDSKPTCRGPTGSEHLYELLLKYSVTSPSEYEQLFSPVEHESAIGEASVRYLYESHVPGRIAQYAPDAKLIAILRDPVDRMYSHYHMNVRQHIEPAQFMDALRAEDDRVTDGWGWDWHYSRAGMYADQLKRYYKLFDRSQLLVLLHSELQSDPLQTMRKLFNHLEVSTGFEPDFSKRAMVGHTPRWRKLRQIIRDENFFKTIAKRTVPKRLRKSLVGWSEKKNRQSIPPLDVKLRQQLQSQFIEHNQELAELLGQELPW